VGNRAKSSHPQKQLPSMQERQNPAFQKASNYDANRKFGAFGKRKPAATPCLHYLDLERATSALNAEPW
jgi:hypothetical protein